MGYSCFLRGNENICEINERKKLILLNKKILSINKNQSNNPHIRAKDTEKYNDKKPEKEVENIGIGGMQIFGGGGGDEKTHTFNKI